MKFNFDEAAWLAKNDPAEFERYRSGLLDDYINGLPPERREKLKALQAKVDEARANMSHPEFLKWLSQEMWINLDDLSNQMRTLNNTVDPDRPIIRAYVCKPPRGDVI